MFSLKNKHAIVFGATDGIGKASALLLSQNGCEISLIARNNTKLDKTLSDHGSVSRGLCEHADKKLMTVTETHDLKKTDNKITSDSDIDLNGKELVSMNMWGFTPSLFDYLEAMLIDFLNNNIHDLKSEFLLACNDIMR